MSESLKDTIKKIVADHLDNGYLAMGQCLTAVGWVGGTLPEKYESEGMIELSMADVAGGGFAVGAALAGKRPMYIIRYQGFNWFNAPVIINYACKSKEIWSRPCPLFIRSISMEGGIGPVAGSSHASLYYRMPGIKICSPMSSIEYKEIYNDFMNNDDVLYVSEHRNSFLNSEDFLNVYIDKPDIVLIGISITRFELLKASNILNSLGINVAIHHVLWIKPFIISVQLIDLIQSSKFGFIISDDDYVDGIAKNIAYDITEATGKIGHVIGLKNRTAGFSKTTDNLPPNYNDIVNKVLEITQIRK